MLRNLVSGRGGTGKKVAAAASGAVVVHGDAVVAVGGGWCRRKGSGSVGGRG